MAPPHTGRRCADPPAIEVLYDRYAPAVFSLALRIVADRQLAEAILEEVFFRVWQDGLAFPADGGSVVARLLSLTRDLALDSLRTRPRPTTRGTDSAVVGDGEPDSARRVEEDAWLRGMRRVAAEALAALSPEERTAIELAYFEGRSVREIAATLGQTPATVGLQLGGGVDRLRATLECHEAGQAGSDNVTPALNGPADREKTDCGKRHGRHWRDSSSGC
jgi:RNA polymerase sigma-70 factor, ECF subfamily